MRKIIEQLTPVDIIVFSYILLTNTFLIIGINKIDNLYVYFVIRLAILALMFALIRFENSKSRLLVFLRYFYPLLFLGYFYNETAAFNNLFFSNIDPFLNTIEYRLFGLQPSLLFSQVLSQKWFSELMHFGYFSYYPISVIVLYIFYKKDKDDFNKIIFLVITSFFIYYLIFIIIPSIGPQFYFPIDQRQVPDGLIFTKIMTFITRYAESATGAFPSSHVGVMIIYQIILFNHFKKKSFYLLPFTILILFATIYLKAHYAIDIIAGIITAPIILAFSQWIWNKYFSKFIY